jgi:hypothetical protein
LWCRQWTEGGGPLDAADGLMMHPQGAANAKKDGSSR